MSSLLSTISGKFTKSFVLGTFFPVAIFVVLKWLLILPRCPLWPALAEILSNLDTQWQAAAALFVAIVISGILYNLNIPLIRLYEGYLFENSYLGRKMRERQVRKLSQLQAQITALRKQYAALKPDDEGYAEVQGQLTILWARRAAQFPPQVTQVAPTELGNVISSFEFYPLEQYKMDAIALWPRLMGVIDETYATIVDDAKTTFDFFLNSSALLAILALAYLYSGLLFGSRPSSLGGALSLLGVVAVLAFLSWVAYRCTIDSAIAWGDHVKTAFDLYRGALLAKLGYEGDRTPENEAALWQRISQSMLYWSDQVPPPPYKKAVPAATRAEPADVPWNITKGVEVPANPSSATGPGLIQFVLKATNAGKRRVRKARLVDTVPSGFDYCVGSAQLHSAQGTKQIEPVGTNPYTWEVGAVDAGQTVRLSYLALQRPRSETA